MKITKKQKNILIISLIVIGIMYFGIFKTFSLLPLPVQTETTLWNGINVELSSPTFDSIEDSDSFRYCDENTISNNYVLGDKLTISSSMASGRASCGSNYIKAKMIIPSGTLSVKCKYGFSIGGSGYLTEASCKIPSLDYSSKINDIKPNQGLGGWYNGFICGNGGCSLNCPGTYCPLDSKYKDILSFEKEYELTEPTEIEVWVLSNVEEGSANAEIELMFNKKEVIIYSFENNKCVAKTISPDEKTTIDFDSLEECSSNIEKPATYYRFENNECKIVNILPSQKTDYDFLTEQECEELKPTSIIWYILGIILLIIILTIVYLKVRK